MKITNEELVAAAHKENQAPQNELNEELRKLPAFQRMVEMALLIGLLDPMATLEAVLSIGIRYGIEIGQRKALEEMVEGKSRDGWKRDADGAV